MGSVRRTILVVDDDPLILAACERVLRFDHDVFTASNVATARSVARTQRPDTAIVDLRIGDASGIDLIRDLKKERPALKVALLSGYLTTAAAAAAVRAGADVVAPKPINPAEVLRQIEFGEPDPDLTETPSLARVEYDHIHRVLADCHGNASEAARRLKVHRNTLQRKLQRKPPCS